MDPPLYNEDFGHLCSVAVDCGHSAASKHGNNARAGSHLGPASQRTPHPGAIHFLYQQQAPPPPSTEQEGFADGFVRALADLHHQNRLGMLGNGGGTTAGSATGPAPTTDPVPVYTDLVGGVGGGAFQTFPQAPPTPARAPPPQDLEGARAERRKLRNRQAALRCRHRKLERIARLEERVAALRGLNGRLGDTAARLRDQVGRLRSHVVDHATGGCQIPMVEEGGSER